MTTAHGSVKTTERVLRTSRLHIDEYFLIMAMLASQRSTCARRAVGCVLVNRRNRVMSTGYNGVPQGAAHCIDNPCAGAHYPSGQGLDVCRAVHAEQNAIVQCYDTDQIHTAYVTASPCVTCMRMLANTSVKRIVFAQFYPHEESSLIAREAGIMMDHMSIDFRKLEGFQ